MTEPDHKPDGSGLDDGPWLPGKGPRRKPAAKSKEELAAIRAKAWATRRTIPTTCIETIDGDPDTAIRLSFQIKVF